MSFREDFVWGAATAAYQIEGAAREDGKGVSIWDVHSHDFRKDELGHQNILNSETGDVACDFYHHYKEDIQLMKQMHLKAFRFSISWTRILPDGIGRVNEAGLQFYSDVVDELLKAGIEPYVTLFHWDYPQQLQELGGWQNPDSTEWFAKYTRVVVERLSDRVKNWMTFNEPQCHLLIGHLQGGCAPKLKLEYPVYFKAMHHLLLAHGKSVQVIRKYAKTAPTIGVAFCQGDFIPQTEQKEDVEAARMAFFDASHQNLWSAAWWLDPIVFGHYPEKGIDDFGEEFPMELENTADMELIAQPLDFIGINAYKSSICKSDDCGGYEMVSYPQGYAKTAFNWAVTPQTLYYTPKFIYERYHLPIIITENGLSSMDWVCEDGKVHDVMRIDFVKRYLQCLSKAAEDGVDVRGYFTWSLMDNMEWSSGYAERFGMIHVDYATLDRTMKDSAYWYSDVIVQNGRNL